MEVLEVHPATVSCKYLQTSQKSHLVGTYQHEQPEAAESKFIIIITIINHFNHRYEALRKGVH